MSEIKLNLLDSQTSIIAIVHGSVGDALVAALSADPETLDELEMALRRFQKCKTIPASSFNRYRRGDIDETPYDAGILVIDLAARIVACDSVYSRPGPCGTVEYHDGTQCTGFPLGYQLSEDWIFLRSLAEYRPLCEARLKQRAASVSLDTRAVLYGEPLLAFVLQNVRSCDWRGPQLESTDQDLLAQAIVDVHRRWLMTPREDLNGQSPRQVLFAKRDLIDFDLDSRMLQWSYLHQEPTPLSRDSHAYRYAGFGTHEWVMYYHLVRFLICATVDLVKPQLMLDAEVDRSGTQRRCVGVADDRSNAALLTELEELKVKWLFEPHADLDGYIPFQVMDNERRRLPEAMTGRSMVIDENCPCCKMMGDESEAGLGIYFCHFDGSNMEDEFAFSSCATIEEWEKDLIK